MEDELRELDHDETADVAEFQPARFASDPGLRLETSNNSEMPPLLCGRSVGTVDVGSD